MNLIDKIDKYLCESGSRPRERHYPSDVSSCLRKLYYKWNSVGESNPTDAGGFWKMRMGDSLHTMIFEFLKDAGLEIQNEVANRKQIEGLKHELSYRIDNLFVDEDGETSGIEIKTSYGRGIVAIQKSQAPKESDLNQICLYMNLEKIPKFYLLYLGRDNGYRTQFLIDYREGKLCANGKVTGVEYDTLIDRLALLEFHLENGKLPHREYMVAIKNGEIRDKYQADKVMYKTDWQCSYCKLEG